MKRIILLFIFILFITGCNKEEKQLVCEKGNLINGKCEIVESIDVSLKCREGYTLNEETKKCENTITIAAKQVSKCPDGYFIGSDLWCFSEKEYPKEVKLNCTSPNIKDDDLFSTTYVKDNVCYEKLCITISEDGTSCTEFKETVLDAKVEESCPDGTKNDDGICRKKYWMDRKYSCELGEMVGKECIIKDEIEQDAYCDNNEYKLNEEKNSCEKKVYETPIYK